MERAVNLTLKEKLSFGVGAVGKDMAFNIVSGFYMLYLVLVVGLDSALVGVAFALTRVFDAINDPIMGTIVDNTRTKWGKFRPWLLIGTLSNAVILVLMHMDFNLSNLAEYFYYFTMYVLWSVTYTLMDVPYWSMIPAISGTKSERNAISSIARIGAGIGAAVTTAIIPLILDKYHYHNNVFLLMGIAVALCFTFFIAFTVLFTKERIVIPGPKIKFSKIFNVLRKNDQLVAYLSTFALYSVGGTIMMTAGIYYFKVVLNRESLMTVFLLIGGGLGSGLAMVIYPFLCKKFTRRNLYIFSLVLTIVGFIFMSSFSFIFAGLSLAIVGVLIGGWMVMFSQGIISIGATVMLADVVDYGEWKFGKRNENITFSMQTFVYKCAAAVSTLIMGLALKIGKIPTVDVQGNFTGDVTDFGKAVVKFVIFVLPIIFVIPSLFFYLKKYKLVGKYHDDMMEELYHKREEADIEQVNKQL